jgi:hypothetical protein
VVQVIGEISNKGAPSRKFVQTFVLAPQTNGWYVLNDIFRYLAEEEEEPIDESGEAASAAEIDQSISAAPATELEAEPVAELAPNDVDAVVAKVDEELEQVAEKETEAEETNGHVSAIEEPVTADDETVNDVAAAGAELEQKAEAEKIASDPSTQVELPKEPAPTPAIPETKATPKVAAVPTPPKPAVPKTWAQLAGGITTSSSHAAPAASSAAAPQVKPTVATPASHTPTTTATTVSSSTPKRQPSPTDSNQDGSSGGWQTAGADHSRNKSRSHAGPTLGENGTVRAYVKNVYQDVSTDALRAELSKYGELSYFDISRQKVNHYFAHVISKKANGKLEFCLC